MVSGQSIESLRILITSHGRGDESAFEKAVESLIRQLTIENKLGEAKYLREALVSARQQYLNAGSLNALPRNTGGLIAFPQIRFDHELFFHPNVERSLQRIVDEHRAAVKLAEAGVSAKTKFLFWGPPGCGKTISAHWLGAQLGLPVGVVRLGALITSYVGETGANVQKIFAAAEQSPMVLLLDEADAVAKSRDDENDVGELRRVVNALLQGLDFFSSKRSLVILATNHSFLFDSAMWRRFDDVVEFPFPEPAQRLAMLKHLTNGLRIKGSLSTVARQMSGHSYQEIARSVTEVAKNSVLRGEGAVDAADFSSESTIWRAKIRSALKKPQSRR